MPKILTINDISLKTLEISKIDGKINLRLSYALLDGTKEYDQKSDSIKDEELTAGQKTYINNIIGVVETKLKTKEGI